METFLSVWNSGLKFALLTSSEVELMETIRERSICYVREIKLLTSSEVELMETKYNCR